MEAPSSGDSSKQCSSGSAAQAASSISGCGTVAVTDLVQRILADGGDLPIRAGAGQEGPRAAERLQLGHKVCSEGRVRGRGGGEAGSESFGGVRNGHGLSLRSESCLPVACWRRRRSPASTGKAGAP